MEYEKVKILMWDISSILLMSSHCDSSTSVIEKIFQVDKK